METRFNEYIRQYELAETLEKKQVMTAQFASFYDLLSAEEKQTMNRVMHPSLLTLKAWTEREIDPLLARGHALLAKKVTV